MKLTRNCLLLCVLTLSTVGCATGDSDDGNGPEGAGVSFTESNAAGLAGIAVSAIEVFPRLSGAYQAIVEAIQTQNALGSAAVRKSLRELGDIGLCISGESNLTWNDEDDDLVLSAGDSAMLDLVDCDELAGMVTFSFSEVAFALTVADVDLSVSVDDDVPGAPVLLEGRFRVEVNGVPGPPESAIARYLVVDQEDPTLGLTASVDAQREYAFGCFNLYFTFDLEQGGYLLAEPFGVFSVPGVGVMSMVAGGLPPLIFENGDYPASGQINLYAESDALPCAALGIGPDGVDANDSFTTLTATGGGSVTLEGETETRAPFSIQTTWDDLR
ncbi:MAG: hypothetical protein AMJ62_06590 [Myxococcales bacterium SG8_38]|nr:MAG: hypothetical protein AMJ62_06590 [Myxococcales bacterium SG8_38]